MGRNNEIPTGWLLTAAGIFLLLLSAITCKRFEPDQLVIIETGAVSDISYSSCTVTGEIYDAGSDGINQHGFVWSIEKDPLIEGNSKSELGSKDNTGTFTQYHLLHQGIRYCEFRNNLREGDHCDHRFTNGAGVDHRNGLRHYRQFCNLRGEHY